jgi:Zn-dependent protease with chaperone function
VYLGLPLLAVLDAAQAAAVVCHELGHHAAGDSRLSALTYRSGDALLATVRRGRMHAFSGLTQTLFRAFAGLYFSVTFAVRRQQELAADGLAARVAGSEAMATALETLPLIAASYAVYMEAAENADPDGFREFFETAVAVVTAKDTTRHHFYDSHPPIAERVAAARRTDDPPAADLPPGRAIDLLRTPGEVAVAVAQAERDAGLRQ